jgi:putative hydrolase of the HAD superfamily
MISYVLIDLDETIISYEIPHIISMKHVYLEFFDKHFDSFSDFFNIYNKNKKNIHIRLHGTASSHSRFLYFKMLCENLRLSYNTLIKIDEYYWKILLENIELKKGIIELFNFFKKREIKICLITDFISIYQFRKLEKFSLLSYFDNIITSEEVGVEKPHPFVFQWTLNKLKLKSDQVIMIGDNYERDIESSINENIFACHYTNSGKVFNVFRDHLVYENHKDLLTFLINLYNGIDKFVSIGKTIGLDETFVQAGGGNISIKIDNKSISKNADIILIKSSGYNLSEVTQYSGYCSFLLNDLQSIIYDENSDKNTEKNIENTRTWIKKDDPSIETYFHGILNKKYIIHTHPNLLIHLFNKDESIPYITPGIDVAKYIIKHNRINDKYLYLENHGIILSTDFITDIYDMKRYIFDKFNIDKEIIEIIENIEYRYNLQFISYTISPFYIDYYAIKITYPCTPDLVVYCGYPIITTEKDNLPDKLQNSTKIIIISNKYIFYICDSIKKKKQMESVFIEYLRTIHNIYNTYDSSKDAINQLSLAEINKLISWEKEIKRLDNDK